MIYRVGFFALCVVGLSLKVAAVELTASVDSNVISLNDRLVLSVRIADAMGAGEPALPELEGFRITNRSHSTQIQMVSGHLSMSGQYDYTLMPLKVGTMTIPPITLTHQNKTYTTEPITVEVREERAAVSAPRSKAGTRAREAEPPPPDAASGKKMFIELSADKSEVYLHEQVTLTFRFYYSGGLAEQPQYEAPPASGFVEKPLGKGTSVNYTRVVGGRQYQVSELKTALYPYQTGELSVGPARLKGALLVGSGRRREPRRGIFDMDDFFNDPFFGHFQRRPFELTSNQLKITVRPLPGEGAPQGEVAVGRYTLQVEAKPQEVHVGDPVTLTMLVKGEGDIERVPPPRVSDLNGFKSYDATSSTQTSGAADTVRGVKKFEQALVPLNDRLREIPEIVFNYFDPRERKYHTLKGGPIPLKVLPPGEEAAEKIVSAGAAAEKKGIKLLERNIVFIKTEPGALLKGKGARVCSFSFWIIQGLPIILILCAILHARHRERLSSDSGYARLYSAGRMTRARLKFVEGALRGGNAEELYGGLVKAITMYVADRLNIPPGGLTPEIIQEKLMTRGFAPDLLKRLGAFFRTCDLARFASAKANRSEMEHAYREAIAILEALRKSKLL